MAQLPLADSIGRFKSNEERIDRFVNSEGSYTTSQGVQVETLPAMSARHDAEFQAAQADLYAARDQAVAAKTSAELARDAANLTSGVYASVAAGLAGTASGHYFSVPAVNGDSLSLFRNNAGIAVLAFDYPGKSTLTAAQQTISEAALALASVATSLIQTQTIVVEHHAFS